MCFITAGPITKLFAWGGEDMCYERRRAEACVDESAHHALANAGGREIVGKKEGEQKGSARGSVHWGCYYATALDIEVAIVCVYYSQAVDKLECANFVWYQLRFSKFAN